MSNCEHSKSVVAGLHPTWGKVFRCSSCTQYWHFESDRLWSRYDESEKPHQVKVHNGPGEMGLANAILLGMQLLPSALLSPNKENQEQNQ